VPRAAQLVAQLQPQFQLLLRLVEVERRRQQRQHRQQEVQ
jgi:hypothetical protein